MRRSIMSVVCSFYLAATALGCTRSPDTPTPTPLASDANMRALTLDAPSEWATDLIVTAGCTSNPIQVDLPKDTASECAWGQVEPAMDANGDFFSIDAPVTWTVDDPRIVTVNNADTADEHAVLLQTHIDIIDTGEVSEPASTVRVCAQNDCPSTPTSCTQRVCAQWEVVSVVDVSGHWTITGPASAQPLVLALSQDGRRVTSSTDFTGGRVYNRTLEFSMKSIVYRGTILDDRRAITGHAWDETRGLALGTWTATRMP